MTHEQQARHHLAEYMGRFIDALHQTDPVDRNTAVMKLAHDHHDTLHQLDPHVVDEAGMGWSVLADSIGILIEQCMEALGVDPADIEDET